MKNLKILIVGLFAFLSFESFGQGWEAYIYKPGIDSFSYYMTPIVDETANGEYVVLPSDYDQLMRIDTNGNYNWNTINNLSPDFYRRSIIATNDNFYIGANNNSSSTSLFVVKLNVNGDTIWTKNHQIVPSPSNGSYYFYDLIQTQDGNIVLIGTHHPSTTVKIIKIDYSDGSLIWSKDNFINFSTHWGVSATKLIEVNNELIISGFHRTTTSSNTGKLFLLRLDNTGNELNEYYFPYNSYYATPLFKTMPSGDFIIYAQNTLIKIDNQFNELWRINTATSGTDIIATQDNSILTTNANGILTKYDSNGNVLWAKNYNSTHPSTSSFVDASYNAVKETANGDYMLFGTTIRWQPSYYIDIYVARLNQDGEIYDSKITGNIYTDQNSNNILDNGETNFNTFALIEVINGTDTSFANSDNQGNYFIGVNPGSYQLKPITNSNYWLGNPQTVIVTPNDTITQDLGLQPIITCSDLKVTITSPVLVRCFSQNYYVNYSNLGTQVETNTYIEIEFDPFLIVNSASIPYTQNGNIYTFQVGNLNINQTGQFSVNVTVSCNAVLGQMHCVDATIYPHQLCLPNALNWSGATIIADAFCSGTDSVSFKLENIGTGNMTQARNYWVIEDQILPLQGSYQLNAGQDTIISIPANGYSYQIQAEQEITHPWGNNVPSAVTFGCNLTDSTITVNGLINQFNLDDYLNFVDVDCQQNVGSYDPNDKQGYPYGYGATNSITKDSEIEYMIRFQNTGTAPAVNVEIKDEIDLSKLDLATLEMQSSSHPYILEIEEGNTLVFKFNNIMLPDSNVNEAASHGFIRFRIAQKANNAIGTVIENSAAIYFDFNAPIVTNTTLHTVDENFVLDSLPVVVVVPTCSASFIINPMNIPNPTWQLTASSTGTAPFTYGWSFDNGNVYQSQNPSLLHNFVVDDSTYVCLTVTDATSCVSTVCQYYFTPNAPTCTASFTYTEQNGTVNFSSYSGGSSFLVYHWNFGDGSTSSAQNPMHTYTTSGTYPVCFMVSNLFGCSDTYCDTIVVSLPIANTCVADFSFQMIGTNTVQFTNLSTSNSNSSFMWDFGNGASGNAINPQYAYTTSGQYFVTLTMTDSLGCTSFASDTVSITTGTTTIEAIESIAISPNPVTDLLQVQMNIAQATNVNISIINRTGQIVNTHSEQLNNGTHRLFIPTTDLAAGMYLLHIQSENGIKTVKFVKL